MLEIDEDGPKHLWGSMIPEFQDITDTMPLKLGIASKILLLMNGSSQRLHYEMASGFPSIAGADANQCAAPSGQDKHLGCEDMHLGYGFAQQLLYTKYNIQGIQMWIFFCSNTFAQKIRASGLFCQIGQIFWNSSEY